MWHAIEPIHAIVYFTPLTRTEIEAVGLKGGWMGYFASRSAPMGPVPAEVVIATFFNFAPAMVRRSIPDAWTFADPQAVIAARSRAAVGGLDHVVGERMPERDMAEAADILRRAAEACTVEGRPLYAAHAALPWPDDPRTALWHGATVLREHRGDGHVATLVAAGLDGCEAHVTAAASGISIKEALLPFRGWTEDEWEAAADRLRTRGWLDTDGALTARGRAERDAIELRTDELAVGPWRAVGDEACTRLEQLLRPAVDAMVEAGLIPYPNPMGLPPRP
jgi:hypothetical protein